MASTGFVPSLCILLNVLLVYSARRNLCQTREYIMLLFDSLSKTDRYTAGKILGLYYELGRVEDTEELLDAFTLSKQDSEILSLMHTYDRRDLFLECLRDSSKLRRSSYDILVAGLPASWLAGEVGFGN
ncbi:OLC1v1028990C1 [Oldenlandia corymbosa var. corymbosa]|uniref:OLC1v1028990C1 n=1 Tax=Oldenlandia corymbosa var. corymbosa TaxID=529605 RepID=A0AAV1CDD6_OLDCO|nr:OLC1v1028990C1 [Oldenlandia corymbosa var. corymbosa]